jgi:hypothetical protein
MPFAFIDKYPLTYKFPLSYTPSVKKEILINGLIFVERKKQISKHEPERMCV